MSGLELSDPPRGDGPAGELLNSELLTSSRSSGYTERHAWLFAAALVLGGVELVVSPVILLATALLLGGRLVAWERRRQLVFHPALVGRELALVITAWFAFAALVYLTDLALQFDSFAIATLPRVVPWTGPDLSRADSAVVVITLHGTLSSLAIATLLRRYAHIAWARHAAQFSPPIAPA